MSPTLISSPACWPACRSGNVFYERLGIDRLFEQHVPDDARLRLSPAAALGVVIRNLVVRHAPVYALGEWAGRYDPQVVGLVADDLALVRPAWAAVSG